MGLRRVILRPAEAWGDVNFARILVRSGHYMVLIPASVPAQVGGCPDDDTSVCVRVLTVAETWGR